MDEYNKKLINFGNYDVVVAGGGLAGVSAAIASGRQGVKTCLVERLQTVGGIATAGLMNLIYSPYSELTGFGKELVDKLAKDSAAIKGETIPFDQEKLMNVLFSLLEKANVDLFLDTWICDVTHTPKGKVTGLVVLNKSGLGVIKGKYLIDATGDADVCTYAGLPFKKGREKDAKMRPMTLLFTVGGIDCKTTLSYVKNHPEDFSADPNQCIIDEEKGEIRIFGFFKLVEKAKKEGYLYDSCNYFRIESMFLDKGIVTVNTIRIYDADGTSNRDINKAIVESRFQQEKLVVFMRKYIPGMENAFVVASGQVVGVRDTRRVIGDMYLTEDEIRKNIQYDDYIGYCAGRQTLGEAGEGHTPDGNEGAVNDYSVRQAVAEMVKFRIPYRILIPKGTKNILVAGRNVSCDFLAHKHLRNQPACITTGYASGVAAALASKDKKAVTSIDIKKLQKILKLR